MPCRTSKLAAVVLAVLLAVSQCVLAVPCALASPSDAASDSGTNYKSYLVDDADIFTDDEENRIKDEMARFRDVANIAVASGNGSGMPTAKAYYAKYIGSGNSGTILFFDMKAREISVYSEGEAYKFVNDSRGTEITDNIYRPATKGDYVESAVEGLGQIYSTLHGEIVFAPMRYVNNTFIE